MKNKILLLCAMMLIFTVGLFLPSVPKSAHATSLQFEELAAVGVNFYTISINENNELVGYGPGLHFDTAGNPDYQFPSSYIIPSEAAVNYNTANEPSTIAIGPDSYFYTLDASGDNLLKFDPITGDIISSQYVGSGPNRFSGITYYNSSLFITALQENMIYEIESNNGIFLDGDDTVSEIPFTIPYDFDGDYGYYTGIAFDFDGYVYLTDINGKDWLGNGTYPEAVLKFSVDVVPSTEETNPTPFPETNPTPSPEPATFLLFGLGILGIAGMSRKKTA